VFVFVFRLLCLCFEAEEGLVKLFILMKVIFRSFMNDVKNKSIVFKGNLKFIYITAIFLDKIRKGSSFLALVMTNIGETQIHSNTK
jgi:hypothetical protein